MLKKEFDLYKQKEDSVAEGELLDFHQWLTFFTEFSPMKLLRRKDKKLPKQNKSFPRWLVRSNPSRNSELTFWCRLKRPRKPSRKNEKVIKPSYADFFIAYSSSGF